MVLDPGFLAQGAELRVDGIELKVENSLLCLQGFPTC